MIFKKKPSKSDLKKFHSFTGVLSLLKTHKVDNEMIQTMFKSLIEKDFFGKGAQGYEKNNPEGDKEIKMKIVNLMLEKFPFLKQVFNGYEELVDTYYKNYRMAKVEA